MRKSIIPTLLVAAFISSCSDDNTPCIEEGGGDGGNGVELVTPGIRAVLDDSQSPMSGVLEAYPCQPGSSIYFGNYVNGSLTALNGMYFLQNGDIDGDNNREISLPVGMYNMVYWGTPKYEEPIYSNPAISNPGLTVGADLSQLYLELRKNLPDTTYYPVFDLVYAVKPTYVGTEELSASLKRQVAGLKVIVKNKNNGVLSASIASMKILIGGIAEKLNFYTAEPANKTKTVTFPLVLSADGTQMSNATVMLFPSADKPLFQLIITLKNGTVKTYKQNLSSPLKSNSKLTLTLTLGDIFSEETSGSFTLDNWQEESETIDIPVLD